MLALIRDLYGHQAWADAQLWRTFEKTPNAAADPKVVELLHHIHVVQRFFLSTVRGEPLTREELMRETELPDLRRSYQLYHGEADSYLSKMRESHLDDHVTVPWFPDFKPKVHEALLQAVMHSLHHRAQIAMLLRQLGGDPKPIDYIIWTSQSRPMPIWDEAATA